MFESHLGPETHGSYNQSNTDGGTPLFPLLASTRVSRPRERAGLRAEGRRLGGRAQTGWKGQRRLRYPKLLEDDLDAPVPVVLNVVEWVQQRPQ